eukprot:COSAG02_NODE_359_length_23842_cov_22.550011_14_plen_202_part_00
MATPPTAAEIEHHTSQLRRFGFTIVPNVIPIDAIDDVATNILRAGAEISKPIMEEFRRRKHNVAGGGGGGDMVDGWDALAREAMAKRHYLPSSSGDSSSCSVEQHAVLLDSVAQELREQHGISDAYQPDVPTGPLDPGINHIAYYPELAPYLADPRVLGVAKAAMDPHIRVAQLEINKTNPPAHRERLGNGWRQRRGYHSE